MSSRVAGWLLADRVNDQLSHRWRPELRFEVPLFLPWRGCAELAHHVGFMVGVGSGGIRRKSLRPTQIEIVNSIAPLIHSIMAVLTPRSLGNMRPHFDFPLVYQIWVLVAWVLTHALRHLLRLLDSQQLLCIYHLLVILLHILLLRPLRNLGLLYKREEVHRNGLDVGKSGDVVGLLRLIIQSIYRIAVGFQ